VKVERRAAFSSDGKGGNPAGVVLANELPTADQMQEVAAEVGYSETVFAAPQRGGFRVRYFAPEAEVAFCGHATIALGAELGKTNGAGQYALTLNDAEIAVEAFEEDGAWSARLVSPNTSYRDVEPKLRTDALALFGWVETDLDPSLEMARINGGAEHLLIPLATHEALKGMKYDFDKGAALMQAHSLVTINLVWRENANTIHSRNPFAGHGVYEDPATGAAAAALAGYMRDSAKVTEPFTVHQGVDMGVPSKLIVDPNPGKGQSVNVAGQTRVINI